MHIASSGPNEPLAMVVLKGRFSQSGGQAKSWKFVNKWIFCTHVPVQHIILLDLTRAQHNQIPQRVVLLEIFISTRKEFASQTD